jgi:hypothetical protein
MGVAYWDQSKRTGWRHVLFNTWARKRALISILGAMW